MAVPGWNVGNPLRAGWDGARGSSPRRPRPSARTRSGRSTHLEFTDIPLVLPASRNGQALSSVYIQAWLGHYLKGDTGAGALLWTWFRYYRLRVDGRVRTDGDIGVAC